MSNKEYILDDIDWDDEESLVDDKPEGGDGKHHFGHLRLYMIRAKRVYEAGHYVTVPGVIGGDFNEKDENGDMMFKGWKKGGDGLLAVLVGTKQSQQGEDYQVVKQYSCKAERNKAFAWGDIVYPAIKALGTDGRKALMAGAYAEWSEVPTGDTFTNDEGEEFSVNAWGNFKIYSDKATMKKAEDEFFNRVSGNSTGTHYPASWTATPDGVKQMLDHARDNADMQAMHNDHPKLATTLGLVDAKTADGEDVNAAKVLSEILNVPEAMIKL